MAEMIIPPGAVKELFSNIKQISIPSLTTTSPGGNLNVTSYVPSGYIPLYATADNNDLVSILPPGKYNDSWFMPVFGVAGGSYVRKVNVAITNIKLVCIKV